MATVYYSDSPQCSCCLQVFAGRREASIESCGHRMCEDCMWIYRHYEACVFCQAPIDHSTIELPRSYRTQNASDELEVHPRSTKRIKREETNDDQTPTRSANEQQTMQRATEIKQRIRARHPDLIYYPDLLTFKTKYRHKLADDNTLYTTFRGVLSNAAVLVYKHTALDIYIVANLDLTIIPVAKALWATINGSRPDQALSSIEQLMFFETTTQNWRVLGHHALKSAGVTDGSIIRMFRDMA